MGDFDFIIVGTGSSASALAWQLTSNPQIRVLMIEEGPWVAYDSATHSGGYGSMFHAAEWRDVLSDKVASRPYYLEPMKGFKNRSQSSYRFKATGGCSLHNGHVLIHPNSNDFNTWAHDHNATEWSWRKLAPYGRTIHAMYKATINRDLAHYPYLDEVMTACQQAGMPNNAHPNPTQQKGCNWRRHIDLLTWSWKEQPNGPTYSKAQSRADACVDPSIDNEPWEESAADSLAWWLRRQSAFSQFLQPVVGQRRNLKIMTYYRVEKVLIDNVGGVPQAVGVRIRGLQGDQSIRDIFTKREVILSAGVYNSPQLLQLSGIGPKDHLSEMGIPVVVDLPGVGSYLTNDGYGYAAGPRLKDSITDAAISPDGKWYSEAGPAKWATKGLQAWDTNGTVPRWDITVHIAPATLPDSGKVVLALHGELEPLGWSAGGSVRLHSANPADPPKITSNAADPSTPEGRDDMAKYLEALHFVKKMWDAPALQNLVEPGTGPIHPPQEVWDAGDEALAEFLRETGGWDAGHAQGSNPMGPRARPGTSDRQTVVDGRLRVHGVRNLRVVDASVFPTHVHGNTNQPAVLVGLRASTLIEEDHAGQFDVASVNEDHAKQWVKWVIIAIGVALGIGILVCAICAWKAYSSSKRQTSRPSIP